MYEKTKEIYSVKLLTNNDVMKLAIFIQKHIFKKVDYLQKLELSDMIDEMQMLMSSSSTKYITVFYREESKTFTYSVEVNEPIINGLNMKVKEYGYDVFEFCKSIKDGFDKEFNFEQKKVIKISSLKKLTKLISILQKYVDKNDKNKFGEPFFRVYNENNFEEFYIFIEIRKRMLVSVTWGSYNYNIDDFIKIKDVDEYIRPKVDSIDEGVNI